MIFHRSLFIGWLLMSSLVILPSGAQASTVYLGDPFPGGIRYHLYYSFDHPGTLTAATGQAPLQIGNPADRQDFGSDGLVDEVGLKAWRGLFDPPGPVGSDEYGWSLNSRWSVVDLSGLHANGYAQAQVSITLEANTTPPVATDKVLIPGITAWTGIETTGTASFTNNWYPNGISTTNWSDWWATDLAASALAGHVWAAADNTDSPAHTVTLTLPWMTLTGTTDYLTLVFGGNDFNQSNPFEFPNFTAHVTVVASPVPLPAALWLFGSGVIGLAGLAQRRLTR
ncbi:MAG: VPLPA-CTERM sorting domain-containing protein [Nitrospira sp.]|nr:VPLPA-CTERM sorting domain-containing protein [Nitrospira sp.]